MSAQARARELQRDYLPKGKPVDTKGMEFHKTLGHEVYQCGAQSSYDPQSGPIYCGRVSDWVNFTVDGVVACCNYHFPSNAIKKG